MRANVGVRFCRSEPLSGSQYFDSEPSNIKRQIFTYFISMFLCWCHSTRRSMTSTLGQSILLPAVKVSTHPAAFSTINIHQSQSLQRASSRRKHRTASKANMFSQPLPIGHGSSHQYVDNIQQTLQRSASMDRASISPQPTWNPADPAMSARERRDMKVQPSAQSGGIPSPSRTYLQLANTMPQKLNTAQHLLVVIDLNGTLLFRPNKRTPTKFIARPHTHRFLKYCIDTFTVVIWSSAKPENVSRMCDAILDRDLRRKVVAVWGRDKFNLSPADYNLRVQCYKRLAKIWDDPAIARSHPAFHMGQRWDQTNTVLVDDSLEKGQSEPFNLIEIPEFVGDQYEAGDFLPQVHDYLNQLSSHSNVSAYGRANPFKAVNFGRS